MAGRATGRAARATSDTRDAAVPRSDETCPQPEIPPLGALAPPEELGPPYARLIHQLKLFPKLYDGEGRLELPPKHRRLGEQETKRKTLVELIGQSPNEADAFGVMVHCMMHEARQAVAGVLR